MATSEVLQVYGTQLLFADHATDFGAAPVTANNSLIIGAPTDVQMDLSVIADGAAHQSAKTASLAKTGSAWPMEWVLGACMESTATPTAGNTFDFYWNASPNATAATGNSGGCSGTDMAYSLAAEEQLIFIGSLVTKASVINISTNVGTIWLPHLYGSLVMYNNSGVAMVADGDADEIHCTLTPVIPDVQAAA